MRGILASVVFLLALSSLARASDSGTSNPTADPGAKSKHAGHAHANAEQAPRALKDTTKTAKHENDGDQAGMKSGGRGSMNDSDDDDDDDGGE